MPKKQNREDKDAARRVTMDVDARLAELGYVYIEGPSGNPSDWVLRQTADNSKGFEWKGA